MRAADEPANPHWVHTLAYLFAAENGGDITDPVVNNAALAALSRCESLLADLRRSARLHSATHTTVVSHLATVTQALAAASRPGVLRQAHTCACGAFRGQPPAQADAPKSPDYELQEMVRDAGVLAAEGDPAADECISNGLTWTTITPNQLIYFAAAMLAAKNAPATDRHADHPDSDERLATSILATLLPAARDRATGTAEHALAALHHPDPVRLRRRQHILLRRILTTLGGLVLDQAAAVERGFREAGGGQLTDPAVRQAAVAALKTFDKFIYANCRVTGVLDEDTYLLIVTQSLTAEHDFEQASRYASRHDL
ncbi:hypothetical protein BLA60_27905 [Actinophytocola xinjiangensis]|uniref:Uncharacterized protein n=1 Tax=Actinophytocola xinjiangensis TaxID=485602 RepID=A0A7Z0WIB0_9PSEU|nr:hypothetical protein [Actinophytocola xinjiangensis]OLF07392.1 hypothetical protein BLA60_27905 [Actinophytocola xinjiangensis]